MHFVHYRLSSAPRLFTKLIKPIFACARKIGIVCFYYIDDSFSIAPIASLCDQQAQIVLSTLQSLGFYANFEKSALIPAQTMVFPWFHGLCLIL
jgi:hypothetical protein